MHCALRTTDCELRTVHCGLCTADYGLCYLKRNGAWDAYLESVQYGLDYVLGRCKCSAVSNCLSVSKGKEFITVVVGPCRRLCHHIVVACSRCRLVVIAVHRCCVIAGFCHHCVVSPSSIVVVVMLCRCLLVGQVRWVGTEVLTNG